MRLGYSQARAARELGIARSHYRRLESGETPIRRVVELAAERLELRET
jgi:transcriptional regulator with XRE-family HTH domain